MLPNSVTFEYPDLRELGSSRNAEVIYHAAFGRNTLRILRKNSVAFAEIRGSDRQYYDAKTAYYRWYFLCAEKATSAAGHSPICSFRDRTNEAKASLHLDAGGRLQFYDANDTLLKTGKMQLKQNGVYLLQAKIDSGTNAPWEIRVNENVELQGTGDLRSHHNGGIQFGSNTCCTDELYIAAIAVDDAAYPPAVPGIPLTA